MASKQFQHSKKKNVKEALIFSALFFLFEFIVLSFHELWRDEIETWTIGICSHSFAELFYNSRYEGFPKLWLLILYILQLFTGNIFYMKVLHLCIATAYVYVFTLFSPFNFIKNIVFCFGYFLAYEYAIISRYCSIEILLLFLCTGLFLKYRDKYLLLISFFLFLLFQANVYAVIIGFCFYVYLIFCLHETISLKRKEFFISAFIVLFGVLISVVSMIPPADSLFGGWDTKFNLGHLLLVLNTISRSYYPVPLLTPNFWNTNITDGSQFSVAIQTFISLTTLIIVTFLFYGNKKVVVLFYAGTLGLLFFTYSKYFGSERHHGQLFLLFVVCLWIYYSDKNGSVIFSKDKHKTLNNLYLLIRKYFVTFVLTIQLIAASIAIVYELRFPFSNAPAVIAYLKKQSLDSMKIIGHPGSTIAISGLLNKDIYFPSTRKWERYVTWDNSMEQVSEPELIREVETISKQEKSDVLVILSSHPIKAKPENWRLLKSFEGAIEKDENYFIYKVTPPDIL